MYKEIWDLHRQIARIRDMTDIPYKDVVAFEFGILAIRPDCRVLTAVAAASGNEEVIDSGSVSCLLNVLFKSTYILYDVPHSILSIER